jgi:hypothetical protein
MRSPRGSVRWNGRSVERRRSLSQTVVTASSLLVCAAIPLLLVAVGFILGLEDDSLAWDFHHELYPQAKEMLAGRNPYPTEGFDPAVGNNLVFPPTAAFLVAPLTLVPLTAADVAMALLGLGCFALALWIVGIRDWRIYGVVALWPPVYIETGLSHLTPVVALLTAAAWRWRDAPYRGGPLVGLAVAVKLFAWPLMVWLAASGRRTAALTAAVVAGSSLLLVLPFTGLDDYFAAVRSVARTYDQDSYTVFGLVVQAGVSEAAARIVSLAVVAALLWATWRYRSFTLAVAAALAASPIVWLDYFALAAIPLALARPRLSPVWFVPLATLGLEGAGLKIGDFWGTVRVLVSFAVVLAVAFRAEQAGAFEARTEAVIRLPEKKPVRTQTGSPLPGG